MENIDSSAKVPNAGKEAIEPLEGSLEGIDTSLPVTVGKTMNKLVSLELMDRLVIGACTSCNVDGLTADKHEVNK